MKRQKIIEKCKIWEWYCFDFCDMQLCSLMELQGFPKIVFLVFFRTWCFVYNSWWENWRIGSFWLLKFSILSRTLRFDELICTNGSLLTAFTKKVQKVEKTNLYFWSRKDKLSPRRKKFLKKKRKQEKNVWKKKKQLMSPKKVQKREKTKLCPRFH